MTLDRRDFLRASAAIAAAWGVPLTEAMAAVLPAVAKGPVVIWLQGQGCGGCSVSLLNSVYFTTVDQLLLNTINLQYHSTLMTAAGSQAIAVAQQALGTGGYVLVVEGAIPTGANGNYATLWPGMTVLQGVQTFGAKAAAILAVGTCAAYGGVVGGKPNPTAAKPLSQLVSGKAVVNIPGCPSHPDWIVGTIAYLIKYGKAPSLDNYGRPRTYFHETVHDECPYEDDEGSGRCQYKRGCKGPITKADCSHRKWNSPAANTYGVNWCIGAGAPSGSPCHGCTEPGFPDAMSPFYKPLPGGLDD